MSIKSTVLIEELVKILVLWVHPICNLSASEVVLNPTIPVGFVKETDEFPLLKEIQNPWGSTSPFSGSPVSTVSKEGANGINNLPGITV